MSSTHKSLPMLVVAGATLAVDAHANRPTVNVRNFPHVFLSTAIIGETFHMGS